MAERRNDHAHRDDLRAIVAALASLRQKRGVSQRELSRRLGLHVMTVSKIESGFRNLTLPEFLDIARELGSDPKEVLRAALGD